jgi:predicted secreted protein
MRWTSALAIFALFWALSLFFVLPFHARRADEVDHDAVPGQADSAPVRMNFIRIGAQVSLVAGILFGLYYLNYVAGWVTRDSLNFFGQPPV